MTRKKLTPEKLAAQKRHRKREANRAKLHATKPLSPKPLSPKPTVGREVVVVSGPNPMRGFSKRLVGYANGQPVFEDIS